MNPSCLWSYVWLFHHASMHPWTLFKHILKKLKVYLCKYHMYSFLTWTLQGMLRRIVSRVLIRKNWESLNPWYLVLGISNSPSYLEDGFLLTFDPIPRLFLSVIYFLDSQQSRREECKRIYFPLAFQIQAQEGVTTRCWIFFGCSSFGPEDLAFSFFV